MAALWLTAGLAHITYTLVVQFNPDQHDFEAFYWAARAWRSGDAIPIDVWPAMNPPPMLVLVLPFSWLPMRAAFALWTLAGALSLGASVHAINRQCPLTRGQWFFVAGAVGILHPAVGQWLMGQAGWLLLYPMTRAFLSRHEPLKAGAWLGLAVAIKPTLLVALLCLPVAYALPTMATGGFLSLFVLIAGGSEAWIDWLARTQVVDWISRDGNASLVALMARIQTGSTLSPITIVELSPIAWLVIAAAAAALWWTSRRVDLERRWALASIAIVLCQPIGSPYYWILGLAPMMTTWRDTLATRTALAILVLPRFGHLIAVVMLGPAVGGALATVPVVLVWWSIARADDAR